jgi:hypothetical protein
LLYIVEPKPEKMIFCNIDKNLIEIIVKESAGKTIVDCGAGDGLLGSLLPNVISLDIFPSENPLSKIIPFDCVSFKFPDRCLPVFIRPCHSGFPAETIENNLEKFETVLYISAPQNIERDLGYIAENFPIRRVGNWVGEDGEFCYKITINKPNTTMKKFVLIEQTVDSTTKTRVSWYELGEIDAKYKERRIYNQNGGYCFITKSDKIIETVEANSWDSELLDNKKTTSYKDLVKDSSDESLKIGWLSPDGTMHYCKYENHISYVHEVLETDVPTIESKGWLHIMLGDDRKPFYLTTKRITQAQADKLREMGINVFDDDIIYQ